MLIPSRLGHYAFSHNGTYQVGCLRRQLAPKAKALPPDMWPRILGRILSRLAYIKYIYAENVAVENAASPTSSIDSVAPMKEIIQSSSYILIPRPGNLPAMMITRVQSTADEQDVEEEASPVGQLSSSFHETSASRYSAVFRFSMDEGKIPQEGEHDYSDPGDTFEEVQDTSFIDNSLSLETSDNLQVRI